jgi:HAD superfamily hydrolase (TIGR01509 family)
MSHPQRPTAVAFDLDGLIFNTEDLYDEVGAAILRRRGKEFTNELKRKTMGIAADVSLQIMIDFHDLDATVEQLRRESEEVFERILPKRLAPMAGLSELLDALEAASIPKSIATGSDRSFTKTVLGHFGYEPRFQFLLTSDDVAQGKPHPEIYLTAADRFGVDPARMMVLEDSENGCRAAIAAGAFTVAVPSPHSEGHDFDGVHLVADGLGDARIYEILGLPV